MMGRSMLKGEFAGCDTLQSHAAVISMSACDSACGILQDKDDIIFFLNEKVSEKTAMMSAKDAII